MVEHVRAGPLDARVAGIRSELVEEDHLPDRSAVLRRVARPWLFPVAVALLGRKNRRNRVRCHGSRQGVTDFLVVLGPVEQRPERSVAHGRRVRLE
jgi:hypothetical protein